MQNKLNEDFIEQYSEQFAAKISEEFYTSHAHINGQEILNVSPSKQVNFFVIKLLFNTWKQESQRLKSPFFDYESLEVKEALLQFMNVLSQFIQVERKEFEVLLKEAIRDTLFLIMAPNVYLEIEFNRKGIETLTNTVAKNILKYIKIAKSNFTSYFQTNMGLAKNDLEINGHIITKKLLEEEIARLNRVLPLTLKKLEEGDEEEENLLRVEEEDFLPPTIAHVRVEEKKAPKKVENSMEEGDENDDILNARFEDPLVTPTIAESHEEQVDSMMAAISVNHRYMLINELFDGKANLFIDAIGQVEKSSSFDDSVEILVKNYAKEYHWDMNSSAVKELLKIIFRRFR